MEEWKQKTCENCIYRVDEYCQRFPPMVGLDSSYPVVETNKGFFARSGKEYQYACSEYKEKE